MDFPSALKMVNTRSSLEGTMTGHLGLIQNDKGDIKEAQVSQHPFSDQHPSSERERVQRAAQDFEALLVAQMLKSAREGSTGAFSGTESDQATESILELGEQQIANALAASGGLGLCNLLVSGLTKSSSETAEAPASNNQVHQPG
jgi:Rod binding domain-containing protein